MICPDDLEPAALAFQDLDFAATLSASISLKRIADSLERLTTSSRPHDWTPNEEAKWRSLVDAGVIPGRAPGQY